MNTLIDLYKERNFICVERQNEIEKVVAKYIEKFKIIDLKIKKELKESTI